MNVNRWAGIQSRSIPVTTHAGRIRCGLSHAVGFWVVAVAFVISTGFTVVTTPLWPTYQKIDHFSTFMVTVAFASYAVGVLISLFLAGHVSDWMGRRTILIPAILLEAVAATLFIFWNDLPGLIVARIITGLGLGMFTSTATAYIAELHANARPDRSGTWADVVATAANIGGFGIGVIVASALVQLAPKPIVTPFVVFLILLLLAAVALTLVPETVTRPVGRRRYRPQHIQVPVAARTRYFAAAAIAFAAFAVLGLFTSLAPSFMNGQLHYSAPLVSGGVILATFTSAAGLQIGIRRLTPPVAMVTGVVLYVTGFVAIIAAVATGSWVLFLIGGILAGGAAGTLFSSAISVAGRAAEPGTRGETLAGIFVSAYAGLAVPVVGLGAATFLVSMSTALTGFAVGVSAIAIIGVIVFTQHSAKS